MYGYVREVLTGLLLSVVCVVAAAVVASIDPWDNGVPWVNWAAISSTAVISVCVSVFIAVYAEIEGRAVIFAGGLATFLFISTFFGWIAAAGLTDTSEGIDPVYSSLVWSCYAVPFLVMPISTLVMYLVGAFASIRK